MVLKSTNKRNLADGLQQLLELNFDAIEAYECAIKKFSHTKYTAQLLEFKADHERHIRNISSFIRHNLTTSKTHLFIGNKNREPIKKGQWVKTFFTSLFNKDSEESDIIADWESAEILISLNLQDEERHATWFETHGRELIDESSLGLSAYKVN